MTNLPAKGNSDSMDNVAVTREEFRQDIGEFLEYIAQALGNVSGSYTTETIDPTNIVFQGTPNLATAAVPVGTDDSTRIPSTSWVRDLIEGGTLVGDGQINFNAGNGLTSSGDNATANQTGNTTKTFTVQAADTTVSVAAGGISVNQTTLNGLYVLRSGSALTGSLTTPERTITGAVFDLSTGPFWTCGNITVPNPTNAVAGMSGLIRVTAAPSGWGANFSTAPTPTVFPSIIPFYVESATSIRLGQAVGVA